MDKDEIYRLRYSIMPFKDDIDYYRIACEYMAKTELYDRATLFHEYSRFDNCAIVNKNFRRDSIQYANQLKRDLVVKYHCDWNYVKKEISKHLYTADNWINEWYKLKEVKNE